MKPSAILLAGITLAIAATASAVGQCRTTVLYNGKITTMDAKNTVASSVVIDGDRILAVPTGRGIPRHDPCARLIDLQGRRVIPGLIDSHNHIVVMSLHPGYDQRLETAASIQQASQMLHSRASALPSGAWVTSIGGWSPEQFTERRMPTLAELDLASSGHPVYLQIGFEGPSATNSAGRAFFLAHGLSIRPDGLIPAGALTVAAYDAIRILQTSADKQRGALDAMQYAASLGLTMSDDKGGPWPTSVPNSKGIADTGDKTNDLNPYNDYQPFLAIDREDGMRMRLRIFFYMQDLNSDLPYLHARLDNSFPDFGDDWLRVSGIGERIYSGPFPFSPNASPDTYRAASELIARKGWAHDEHAAGLADEKAFTAIWETVNAQVPLAPLHWCLAHVPGIDRETLLRLRAMGVGVSAAGSRYIASTPPRNSPKDIPPFRLLVDSGIHVGYGSDGGTVSALNPWLHMYYMVTGKNSAGELVAPGQTLTRLEALRLYTANQPWFTHEEDKLGSIEPGKLADLVVLNRDFLDMAAVPDDDIKQIASVLTLVGGKVVYRTTALRVP